MPSTVIRAFDYSPAKQELTIAFVTGRRYVYSGVPETIVEEMKRAFAKERYFNRRIRDSYPCRELV